MTDLLHIKGGRILDPANDRDETADLFVRNGRIVGGLRDDERAAAEVIDAAGLVVAPGFVDIHVHFREPGGKHKETIRTGSEAAAAGGFTSVVCMPNTSPAVDNLGTLQQIHDIIRRDALVHVYPTGCLTLGRKGEELAPIGSLAKAGVVAITDDGDCIQNNELMRRAVEYGRMFDLVVMDHCQDMGLSAGGVMNEGLVSLRLGLRGWPNAAEDMIVARNAILAHYTGAHIHLQHISSGYSVDIIRRVKGRGIRLTAEASPHHLDLTDAALADYDTNFKMNPPLRTEEDRQALIAGVLDGTLDCLGTDHAPHTVDEKDCELDQAPFGVIGLETALPVYLKALYHPGHADLTTVVRRMTVDGARILGLPAGTLTEGAAADIAIFAPDESWTVDARHFLSKSRNCPWHGETLRGRVHVTICGGRIVFRDGEIRRPADDAHG